MNTNIIEKEEEIKQIVTNTKLQHIAIIMDGNRRWAKAHNYPSAVGHKKGVDALKNTLIACENFGIKHLTVYAFSTENWNRKEEEVTFLMELFCKAIEMEIEELCENNVLIDFIGNKDNLSTPVQNSINQAVERTKNNTGVQLHVAFNYGARDEIVHAVKNIIKKQIPAEKVTEDVISNELYTAGMPNPDLLIRTGGEKRVSNYLLWQIAYSEIIVTEKFWPEFGKQELANSIVEFSERHRRFGA